MNVAWGSWEPFGYALPIKLSLNRQKIPGKKVTQTERRQIFANRQTVRNCLGLQGFSVTDRVFRTMAQLSLGSGARRMSGRDQ